MSGRQDKATDGLFPFIHCNRCGRDLPREAFYARRGDRTHLPGTVQTPCKDCRYLVGKAYRMANPERELERRRRWRHENLERARAQVRRWAARHREYLRQCARARYWRRKLGRAA